MSAPAATPLVPILFFGAVLLAVGAGVWLAYVYEKKRTALLADASLRMGFNFRPKLPKEEIPTLGSFHLFNLGHNRTAKNVMTGRSEGSDVTVLDYQYVTGGGKNSHTWSQTVAIFPGAEALPAFMLSPEHWWDKLGEILGHKDINFDASPEFSKHYLLKGPDEARIRAEFGAEALGFFAQQQGWSVESAGGKLAVYRADRRSKPEELPVFMSEVAAVRRALVHD